VGPVRRAVEQAYHDEWARLVAVLARWTGDLDRAEEAVADAFATAVEAWERDGVPDNPAAWLQTAARRRVLDRVRRERTASEKAPALYVDKAEPGPEEADVDDPFASAPGRDPDAAQDLLRLVFTCCHPAIAPAAQVGLALRLLCGLTTDEVARAFGVPAATVAQRVVRAKKKVRDAGIPFAVPTATELPARLPAVLAVVGLVYTEGHAATEGPELVRADLCDSALRLAGLLHRLLPHEPEVSALRSLLLVTDARRDARLDATGRLVRLADSDRTRWRHADLDLGVDLATESLMRSGRAPGPWTLQAAIAVANAAPVPDRSVIAALYDRLAVVHPSRAVLANRAAATALAAGPRAGLAALGDLQGGHLVHALRAELLAELGRGDDAAEAFRAAISSARNEVERRHLAERAAMLGLPPLTGDPAPG